MKKICILTVLLLLGTINCAANEKCVPMHAPNTRFEECCTLGVDLIPRNIFEKCIALFPMPANSAPRGCISDCIFKELKISNDGKLNKDAVKAYIVNATKTKPEFKSIIEGAVDKCAADAEAKPALVSEACGNNSGFLIGCLHGQILLQCPNMQQKPECNELKQFVIECGMVMPKKKSK